MGIKILNLDFWHYLYIYSMAEMLINKGHFKKAIELIESYLVKKKYATEALYYTLGKAYYGVKNYKLAIESFQLSIDHCNREDVFKANTYYFLGISYYDTKEFSKAISALQSSIRIKETVTYSRDIVISLSDLYFCLGRTFVMIQDIPSAHAAFGKGLKYNPHNKAIKEAIVLLS